MTHTPGPWTVKPADSIYFHVDAGHYSVANVFGGKEAYANARLIAASPDLLAALRHMVDAADNLLKHFTVEGQVEGGPPVFLALARDMGADAIAKAEGR